MYIAKASCDVSFRIAILINQNTSEALWPDGVSELTLDLSDLLLPPEELLLV